MDVRFARPLVAIVLMVGLWALGAARQSGGESWVQAAGAAPRPVRILEFYSSVGSLKAGESAQLCYSVENAKLVRIAPLMEGVFAPTNRCLDVVPLHTTHYTILAEGFDGHVAMKSLTLPVEVMHVAAPQPLEYAGGSSFERWREGRCAVVLDQWLAGVGLHGAWRRG